MSNINHRQAAMRQAIGQRLRAVVPANQIQLARNSLIGPTRTIARDLLFLLKGKVPRDSINMTNFYRGTMSRIPLTIFNMDNMPLCQEISEVVMKEVRNANSIHDTTLHRQIVEKAKKRQRIERRDAIAWCVFGWREIPFGPLAYIYHNYGRHFLVPNGDGRDFDEDNLPKAHILASPPPAVFTNEEFFFSSRSISSRRPMFPIQ